MARSDTALTSSPNLAARMGRWSAAHWKTATFGWLALVVVAFGDRRRRRDEDHRPEHGGAGRVRPHGQDPRRRLQAARRRERPRSRADSLRTDDPAFRAAIADVVAGISKLDVVQNVRSPLDPANAGQIAKNGHAALVEFEIRGDRRQGGRQDRPGPRPGRRGAAGPPAALHRRVRRRERGRRRRDRLRRRPGEGRAALAPDHADHPRDRVRRARGRGHPAAARADRRLRDVRAARAAEPPAADGDRRPRRSCS